MEMIAARSSSTPARPSLARLRSFKRLIWPSVRHCLIILRPNIALVCMECHTFSSVIIFHKFIFIGLDHANERSRFVRTFPVNMPLAHRHREDGVQLFCGAPVAIHLDSRTTRGSYCAATAHLPSGPPSSPRRGRTPTDRPRPLQDRQPK